MMDDASLPPGKLIPLPQGVLRFGPFRFDLADRCLYRAGVKVHLTPKAADVLAYLLAERGKIIGKDEFFDVVWDGVHVGDESITQAVSMIRQALGDASKHPRYVETVTGRGYRFIASVSVELVAPVAEKPRHLVAAPGPRPDDSCSPEHQVGARPARSREERFVAVSESPAAGVSRPAVEWPRATRAVAVAVVAVAMVTGGLAVRSLISRAPDVPTGPVVRMTISLPPGTHLWGGDARESQFGDRPARTAFDITPDGSAIVFAATDGVTPRLYVRYVGAFEPQPIAGTDGASSPFVSPDGAEVGFIAGGEIMVVPIEGGAPRTVLADAPFGGADMPNGVSWADGWIVFGGGDGRIYRVPVRGGDPEPLTDPRPDDERHLHPRLLPGGETLLYTRQKAFWVWETSEIVAQPIGGAPVVLVADGADARYVPTGHLVFARRGHLMAAPLDVAAFELGDPAIVEGHVMQAAEGYNTQLDTGAAQFSVSASGALAYVPGGMYAVKEEPPVWIDRRGDEDPFPVASERSWFAFARLSPDGKKLAYRTAYSRAIQNIVVRDLETGQTTELRLDGKQRSAIWSPDGRHLAFESNHEGPASLRNIYRIGADLGRDSLRRVTESGVSWLCDWSIDDKLFYLRGINIWVVDAAGKGSAERFLHIPDKTIRFPTLSPDGRWLAYVEYDRDTEQSRLLVRSLTPPHSDYPISANGTAPAWSRDGSELFYTTQSTSGECASMMAVRILDEDNAFGFGGARNLFDRRTACYAPLRAYDVAPDDRFLMLEPWDHPPQAVTRINFVVNGIGELKRQ